MEQWLSTIKGSKMLIKHPLRGEKKELLDLARKNAREIFEHFRDKLIKDKEKSVGALEELATLLQLREIPYRIEAFDISNIQGTDSVASMVVFENGKPKNSDYRRFKIKTVEGANDYGSMQEVVYRRFRKGLEEQAMIKEKGIADLEGKFSKMPKLILIDGGLGHLNAVRDVLNALGVDIPLAGMVKDDRHRTRGLIYQGEEIELNQYPNAFQLVGRVQEEAHRFAITYHKSLRGKTSVQSVLDEIPGIGEKRRVALLRHFGSIDKIKKASLEELGAVEGMNRGAALQVQQFLLNRKG